MEIIYGVTYSRRHFYDTLLWTDYGKLTPFCRLLFGVALPRVYRPHRAGHRESSTENAVNSWNVTRTYHHIMTLIGILMLCSTKALNRYFHCIFIVVSVSVLPTTSSAEAGSGAAIGRHLLWQWWWLVGSGMSPSQCVSIVHCSIYFSTHDILTYLYALVTCFDIRLPSLLHLCARSMICAVYSFFYFMRPRRELAS